MFKTTIIILVGLIVYFFLRLKKGMSKIDSIYSKVNAAKIEQKKVDVQKQLIKNKTLW